MKDFCLTQKDQHPLREISLRNNSKNKTINQTNTNALYRPLDNIKDDVKSQSKLIKRPDTILLFNNCLSSKSKDSQADAIISRSNSSVFSYYKQNLYHPQESYQTLTNKNYKLPPYFSSSQISKEKSNITSNKKGFSSIELLSINMILNTLKQERGSFNDLKQTEADSSFDQKISFVNKKRSNRNPFYLHYINDSNKGIRNSKYNIVKSKFSNIPENTLNNSKSLMLIKRKKTNYLTQQLTHNKKRSIKLLLKKNRAITSNYNDQNEYYNIGISKMNSRNIIKSKDQNSNKTSFDEYSNSLDSPNVIFRPKTSRSIKNLFIQSCNTNDDNNKTRPMIQIIFNNNINWIKENIRPISLKLVKLIDKECISQIEAKCKLRKSEKIKLVLHSLEKKTNKPIPQLQIKQVPLLTGSLFQTSAWNDKSKYFKDDLIATAVNKSYYIMKMRPKYEYNFDVKMHFSLTRLLIEKYDDLMYCLILEHYFPKNIQVHPKIRFNIEQSPNKHYTINLLKADFKVNSNNKNDDDTSNIAKISRKGKKTFNTVISRFDPIFKKMILKTSSLSLNVKQSRNFHKMVVKENNLRRKKSITILPRKLYSRKGFDVTNLKKLANRMNLSVNIKRKGKNIDFHLIDEQEEIKKNRNMSKESLVFRTQEIKIKMKDKLKTIEEIIFFLIQEHNIKEIKNIIEQYQLPLEARDDNGNTYLIVAVQCCFIECILYLLHKGADINAQNYELNTPLHMALLYKSFTIVDILLKHEADEAILNKYNFTPWELLHLDKKY